ncbi:MAG: hypothetical protein IJ203_08285 [Atopobiaceae bacterium]|nr:hypothetical protein [Atopobiaceae bacterium]
MGRITKNILYAACDLAYDVVDLFDYLAWRLGRAMDRDQRVEFAVYAIGILLFLVAAGLAGASDYADESAQIAYWQERGVTIARW